MKQYLNSIKNYLNQVRLQISNISTNSLEWLSYVALHSATIPALIALMTGITDSAPSLDVVLIVWLGLCLSFLRAVILRNMINIITLGLGFVIQAVFLVLIFF
jgi:hypothetical protein